MKKSVISLLFALFVISSLAPLSSVLADRVTLQDGTVYKNVLAVPRGDIYLFVIFKTGKIKTFPSSKIAGILKKSVQWQKVYSKNESRRMVSELIRQELARERERIKVERKRKSAELKALEEEEEHRLARLRSNRGFFDVIGYDNASFIPGGLHFYKGHNLRGALFLGGILGLVGAYSGNYWSYWRVKRRAMAAEIPYVLSVLVARDITEAFVLNRWYLQPIQDDVGKYANRSNALAVGVLVAYVWYYVDARLQPRKFRKRRRNISHGGFESGFFLEAGVRGEWSIGRRWSF